MANVVSSLTLPARDRVQVGTPVLVLPLKDELRAVVLEALPDEAAIVGYHTEAEDWTTMICEIDDLVVDLRLDTGRMHAVWRLLTQCSRSHWPALYEGIGLWLEGAHWHIDHRARMWAALNTSARIQEWLSHLNPLHSIDLEDGTPWVDAEALRVISNAIDEGRA